MPHPVESDHLSKAHALFKANDLDKAEELITLALAHNPGHFAASMLRARICEARKDPAEATDQYRRLCNAFPENPLPPAELSRFTMNAGDFEAAAAFLAEAEALGLPRDRLMQLRVRMAALKGDTTQEMKLLEELLDDKEQPAAAQQIRLVRLAQLQARLRNWAVALATARQVLARSPNEAPALVVAANAAVELGDDKEARSYLEKLVELDPSNAAWTAQLVRYLVNTGKTTCAAQVLRTALDKIGDASDLHQLSLILKLPPELIERSILWAEAVTEKASDREKAVAVEILMRHSRPVPVGLAQKLGAPASRTADLVRWWQMAPSDSDLKRPVITDDMSEVIVARGHQPAATVLVFTGLGDQLHVPLFIYDRYLAALNVDAIYLRDPSRYLFNNGIPSVAEDFAGSVAHLRSLLDKEGGRPSAVIGTSAGGFAAIRYGLTMQTRSIICFSGPTNLSHDFLADEGRGMLTIQRLKSLPPDILDTRTFVRDADGHTAIHLYYGARMPQDERHARHLEGEPGVTLHPLAEVAAHSIVMELAGTGELLDILRRHILDN
ncbi:tetratricopeptide repeat protein [Paracoccus sp. SY]|uniref:tetratricopeptide repeat protein n=1 Tax=Paracoccus sp. SY TaxID=1330255 RepID=UPI000CD1D03E|nr:tetratricopeptide repeat protein [Paracoccus sp. SY]